MSEELAAPQFECPRCGGHTAVQSWMDHDETVTCDEKSLVYRDASVWEECWNERCGVRRKVAMRETQWSYLTKPPTRMTRWVGPDGAVLSMKIETVEDVA